MATKFYITCVNDDNVNQPQEMKVEIDVQVIGGKLVFPEGSLQTKSPDTSVKKILVSDADAVTASDVI